MPRTEPPPLQAALCPRCMAVNDVAASVCSTCHAPLPGAVLRSAASASMGAGLAPLSSGFPDEIAADSAPLPLRYAGPAGDDDGAPAATPIGDADRAAVRPHDGTHAVAVASWRPQGAGGPFQVGFAADGHALIQVTPPPADTSAPPDTQTLPEAGLFDGSAVARRRRPVQPGTAFIGGAVVASLVMLGGFAWVRSASQAPSPTVPVAAARAPEARPAEALVAVPKEEAVAAPPAPGRAAANRAAAAPPPAPATAGAASPAPANIGPCTAAVAALGLCAPETASPTTATARRD